MSQTSRLSDAVVTLGDYAVGERAGEQNVLRLRVTEGTDRLCASCAAAGFAALDLALLAHGRTDASITPSIRPWDVAAGVAIARAVCSRDLTASPERKNLNTGLVCPLLKQEKKMDLNSSGAILFGGASGMARATAQWIVDGRGSVAILDREESAAGVAGMTLAIARDLGTLADGGQRFAP